MRAKTTDKHEEAERKNNFHLSDDLMYEIILRLPVKSLIESKRICKSWHAFISDSEFQELYFQRSKTRLLLLQNYPENFLEYQGSGEINCDLIKTNIPNRCLKVLASCNILFCVSLEEEYGADNLFLWNPISSKFRKIPSSLVEYPLNGSTFSSLSYGLGYDSSTRDYKLVRIAIFDTFDIQTEVKMYSMKTNIWRRIPDFPYDFPHDTGGIFINGALHWIVSQWNEAIHYYIIVALDLAEERYRSMPMPPEFKHKNSYFNIGVLGECLILYSCGSKIRSEIWVMTEYGNVKSWKKFNILIPGMTVSQAFSYFKPLCLSKKEEILLTIDANTLGFYHIKEEKCRFLRVESVPQESSLVTLVESSVTFTA